MSFESTHTLVDLSGAEVLPGNPIVSFRGETWVFDRVTRPPGPDNAAMIRVRPPGHDEEGFAREYYLSVFPGFVVRPRPVSGGGDAVGEALADLRAALELFAPLRSGLEFPSNLVRNVAQLNKISRKIRNAYDRLAADRDG